jgi:nicotinate-nucleotide adenylyltransferase
MKIGILGGTFDPIHEGHLAIARAAKKQFQLDKVFFIPALAPPHKVGRRDLTPAAHRYRMVELAIRNEPAFEISDIEFNRPDLSYTVETLRMLKSKHPNNEWFLILGADSLAELHKWRESDEIKTLATILVAARPGTKKDHYGHEVNWVSMPEQPISSSEIRKHISEGTPIPQGALPEAVEGYIKKMHLYKEERSCTS